MSRLFIAWLKFFVLLPLVKYGTWEFFHIYIHIDYTYGSFYMGNLYLGVGLKLEKNHAKNCNF